MDNIANKIGKLYNHSTYSEKNGGSIFMTVLILFVFFIALSYYYVMAQAQPIKDNWVNERCSPAVMPFAGLINKPDGQSAFDFTGENFSFCTQNIIKEITGIFLIPINASQNLSSSCLDSLSVGSIITVFATGNDTVGAWNP